MAVGFAGPLDWNKVMRIAARHRVEGLLAAGTRSAGIKTPPLISERLSAQAHAIAVQNIVLAAETHRLYSLLVGCGIDAIVLKGVTINLLGYGTLGVKKAWDIDLLIDTGSLDLACGVLREAGYQRIIPDSELSDEQAAQWLRWSKESLWRHRESGLFVELHTRLGDNPTLIPSVGLSSPRQRVEVGAGRSIETLAPQELFAYLCVHGASHGWARLKWLADVGALLSNRDTSFIEKMYRASAALGAGRTAGQALLLCEALLGTQLPDALGEHLRSQRTVRLLARMAVSGMTGRYSERELDDSLFGTVPIQVSHFLLAPGLQHKKAELKLKYQAPWQAQNRPLSPYRRFLLPILLLPRWIARRVKLKRGRLYSSEL